MNVAFLNNATSNKVSFHLLCTLFWHTLLQFGLHPPFKLERFIDDVIKFMEQPGRFLYFSAWYFFPYLFSFFVPPPIFAWRPGHLFQLFRCGCRENDAHILPRSLFLSVFQPLFISAASRRVLERSRILQRMKQYRRRWAATGYRPAVRHTKRRSTILMESNDTVWNITRPSYRNLTDNFCDGSLSRFTQWRRIWLIEGRKSVCKRPKM